MSKIFARLRRATFTTLPRSGPFLSFCPKSTARRAFSVLTQISAELFRFYLGYGRCLPCDPGLESRRIRFLIHIIGTVSLS